MKEILTALKKIPTSPSNESANTWFGKRNYLNFYPQSATLEDTTRELLKHYGLEKVVGVLPGENSWYVRFVSGMSNRNPGNTIPEGTPGDADFRLVGVEITNAFIDNKFAQHNRYRTVLKVLLHEICHVICMRVPLSDKEQIKHGAGFQSVRREIQRITGVKLPKK
ncbi:sprT-like family domain-containing protein [Ditylenchus destructor]|nr:sprT-like family domain-containing protein [Ditylenchus destructor]